MNTSLKPTVKFARASRQCTVPRDPKGCPGLSQVRTRRRAAKRGATIIEVYRNGSSGGLATLGAYDPERREVGYGVTGRKNMGFSTGGVKNRIRRERKKK